MITGANLEKQDLEQTLHLVEIFSKLILGGIAFLYALGLITVNLYYSHYGVYSLSLFRVSYILAGIWVIFPIIMGLTLFLIIYALYLFIKWLRGEHKTKKFKLSVSTSVLIAFCICFALTVFFAIITLFNLGIEFNSSWITLLISGLGIAVTIIALIYIFYYYHNPLRRFFILSLSLFIFLTLLQHTYHFAHLVYGTIPSHIGGGGIKQVQLLLDVDENSKKYFEGSGLIFYENTNQTRTTQLIFETENEYVLLVKPPDWALPKGTLSIKRDMIKSVLYEGFRWGGAGGSYDNPEPK